MKNIVMPTNKEGWLTKSFSKDIEVAPIIEAKDLSEISSACNRLNDDITTVYQVKKDKRLYDIIVYISAIKDLLELTKEDLQ